MHRARYYQKESGKIRCLLCPRCCLIGDGQSGSCGVRRVNDGELYTTNYGCLSAAHRDPIEKKPLYHFFPGKDILSLGTYGCNLLCSFCQNWTLSRGHPGPGCEEISPEEVLAILEREGGPQQSVGVAYTYNEPLVWYEFVYDTAKLLHRHGYRNVLVTNGYINSEPFLKLLPYIDAMNIDLKGFSDSFYREYCRGERKPVMDTVEAAVGSCHVEVTCLLIPSLNDNIDEQEQMAEWLAGLDQNLPLHYSRYFPQYKLDLPPTPPETMLRVRDSVKQYLHYVYLGNIELPGSSDTICPHCGNRLIERSGYRVALTGLDGIICNNCRNRISIVVNGS